MFFLLIRRPPRTILTYTLFPYPTLFLSTISGSAGWARSSCPALFRNRRPGCSLSPASASWAPHCAFAAGRPQPPDRLVRDHLRGGGIRSEEHTSELQSLMRISYAVFCLKKKT